MSEHQSDLQDVRPALGEAWAARPTDATAAVAGAAKIPQPRHLQDDAGELWAHRTEPISVTLYDELVIDRIDAAYQQYDEAVTEIARRYRAAEQTEPEVDYDRYVWWYGCSEAGDFAARAPEAPTWSRKAWWAQPRREYETDEYMAALEDMLQTGKIGRHTYIAKSRQAAEQLWRLEDERAAKLTVFGDLEEQLEQQRIREWTVYRNALKARIEALARSITGLEMDVNIVVDAQSLQSVEQRRADARFWNSLEFRLIESALLETPAPGDLPGTPLERLERSLQADNK